MDEYYIATIMLLAYQWAPRNFALCQGQLLPITQNQALYSLLGNNFGGTSTNFNLPDLRGRVPCGFGQGPKTQERDFAEQFGNDQAALVTANVPPLAIREVQAGKTVSATAAATVNALDAQGNRVSPKNFYWARGYTGTGATSNYADSHDATMAADAVQVSVTPTFTVTNLVTGGSGAAQAFDLNPPSLPMNYCICTQGLYPSRE